ncbi:unnamed protein product [Urochloa humidicola]
MGGAASSWSEAALLPPCRALPRSLLPRRVTACSPPPPLPALRPRICQQGREEEGNTGSARERGSESEHTTRGPRVLLKSSDVVANSSRMCCWVVHRPRLSSYSIQLLALQCKKVTILDLSYTMMLAGF